MILTDTHTHLYYETDPEKRSALMQRSLDNKVSRLFLPNVNTSSIPLVSELVNEYPQYCYPMLGLHPCDVKEIVDAAGVGNYLDELGTLKNTITKYKIYAIGEIGIDLYWDKTTLGIQKKAFIIQINWAKDLGLPVVIHCREAFDEIFEILNAEKNERLRGILHCFTGTADQAKKIIDLGFYLGIGGILTYKNSGLSQVLCDLSLQNIVLETDSPYLAPVPHRGKPNESSFLIHVAQAVADIKCISVEEVARITTENSMNIFGV